MFTPWHMALLRDEKRAKEALGLVKIPPGAPIQLYGEYRGDSDRAHGADRGDTEREDDTDNSRRKAPRASAPNYRKLWWFLPTPGR